MPRPTEIQAILEEAIAESFETALPKLRGEIARRAAQELEFLTPAPGSGPTDLLNAAVGAVLDSNSQAEILRHFLEGAARFTGRAALFVVKGSSASGWQATGFENNEAIRNFNLGTGSGLIARAVQGRAPAGGAASEFDTGFVAAMKSPAEGSCLVLPLVVKEKVAAIIYADPGTAPGGALDPSALGVLARFAALWLELSALRKVGAVAGAVEEAQPPAPSAPAARAATTAAPAGEDAEIHKKAKRFAKLLVDEIKLYNQSKVSEGRQNRDLYDRLREDIEKSRSTYQKRYGESAAGPADYFTEELIRVLADNDVTLMGANFPR